jgi:parvulin-like peptidyl-prolyl isomerase
MMRKNAPGLLICSIGLMSAWGCAGQNVRPLSSSLFVPVTPDAPADASLDSGAKIASDRQSTGNTGELPKKASILPASDADTNFPDIKPIEPLPAGPTTNPSADFQGTESTAAATAASAVIPAEPVSAPAPVVDAPTAAQAPVTPAGQETNGGQGVYMTLGGVVAVVNDTPIFANQVLEPLNREFAVKAKEMDEKEFRDFAMKEIGRQAMELIQDEVYFAEAYHALSDEDRKLAQYLAIQKRFQKVTAAGGSVELARQKTSEEGEDFDEALKKEYRITVIELYRERHIEPMVQVTADGMRDFYRRNVDKRYSDKDKIQFRLIEVDPHFCGGMQPAMDKIEGIREKAIHGADFEALAAADNDDTFCKAHGGNPMDAGEWVERNSYPNEALEKALWELQPGQITPVVKTDNVLYIAKLMARHDGVVRPFEDPAVQDDIYRSLRQAQLTVRMQLAKEETFDAGMIDTNEDRLQVALDMAMQKYAQSR